MCAFRVARPKFKNKVVPTQRLVLRHCRQECCRWYPISTSCLKWCSSISNTCSNSTNNRHKFRVVCKNMEPAIQECQCHHPDQWPLLFQGYKFLFKEIIIQEQMEPSKEDILRTAKFLQASNPPGHHCHRSMTLYCLFWTCRKSNATT